MDFDFFGRTGRGETEERNGGSLLSKRGELTKLQIKTVAGSKLNPADRKKAEELVKDMYRNGDLLNDDYIWCSENNIR